MKARIIIDVHPVIGDSPEDTIKEMSRVSKLLSVTLRLTANNRTVLVSPHSHPTDVYRDFCGQREDLVRAPTALPKSKAPKPRKSAR